MKPEPNKWSALAGSVFACAVFTLGYVSRGSNVENDARLERLQAMSVSLDEIAANLPTQKIVEVEKIVETQAPYCAGVEKEMKLRRSNLDRDALGFCKQLMFGREGSNVMVPNLYEAISQSGERNAVKAGSLEDRIMSHVLLVLIECFQNT